MAQKPAQTWLTSVVDDAAVPSVLVLAKSIRRTKSTRQICVITSKTVSTKNRFALREAFDTIIYMDETESGNGRPKEDKFKLFALSLRFLQKGVYLSPTCLLLENADYLFDSKNVLDVYTDVNGSVDMSVFSFTPKKDLWKFMWATSFHNLKAVLKNNNMMGKIPHDIVGKFSLANLELKTDKTHAPIIHFVDTNFGKPLEDILSSLSDHELGLREKLVRSKWMKIFEKTLLDNESNVGYTPTESAQDFENEPIAIVGMSCRYPGANSIDEFWNMLVEGKEGIREPPPHRWTKEKSLKVTKTERSTNAGFLSTTIDEFDARFFGVSPKEAAYMDPQARLLHEVMWESLEDGGIDPLSLYGTHTGIFVGSWMNDYKDIAAASMEKDFFRVYMGNSIGASAARLSFLLGLTGPSIATESGCSSAMVAVDLAVKSLRSSETNLVLAGGVNLLLHPFTSDVMNFVIAENGRCKTFDAKADGFGRAEGCGVMVMKRLSDALRDRDNIWAIIRGSAVSQEGISKSLGTPTVHCEALAMQLALKDANVCPEEVSFVETHGTGTSVGDPMEVAAIRKAYYSPLRSKPLILGSVKTNVGHTESCSGITGIMKTILALQHETIPQHLNMETLNPEIFLDNIPAMIPMEAMQWPKVLGKPRIAGVSSFGITGTDGHVIIQEAPDYQLPKFTLNMERPTHLLAISGKTSEALSELLQLYENLFQKIEDADEGQDNAWFPNAAYSANVGRASFPHRCFLVANSLSGALKELRAITTMDENTDNGDNRRICFLFPGQGSQYPGMAKSLYETSPVFRTNFDICDKILKDTYKLSIKKVLWEDGPESKQISQTLYSQTAIFCVEYCLLKLWQSWGIQPDHVLGHSLGEFCAAVCCGILSFEDALKLVAERSRLIDNLPRGSMLVLKASKKEVETLLKDAHIELDFAAVNSPDQTVVAGDTAKVESFLAYVKGNGGKGIILESTHAFHSRHMDPMLEKYRRVAASIQYREGNPNIQYISGMEGRVMFETDKINADYWVRHTREKVSFVDACTALRETGCTDFVEVGPHPVLSSFVLTNLDDIQITCLPSLRRGTEDWNSLLTSLGKLYVSGHKIDWKGYDGPYLRRKVSLPFHPFNRKSFWAESIANDASIIHPLVGHQISNASPLHMFQSDISLKSLSYLKDHCVGNRIIFPGAGFTEMSLSAGHIVANALTDDLDKPPRALQLENLLIEAPLELLEGVSCRMQVVVDLPQAKTVDSFTTGYQVKVYHRNSTNEDIDKWILHSSSTLKAVVSTKEILQKWNPERISELISGESKQFASISDFYKRTDTIGLKFGESFRMIKKCWVSKQSEEDNEVVTEMSLPPDHSKYLLHPLIIDAAFQSGMFSRSRAQLERMLVPVRVGQLTFLQGIPQTVDGSSSILFHVKQDSNGRPYCFICTSDLHPIALMQDVEFLETTVRTIESVLEQQSSNVPDAWEEIWNVIPSPSVSAVDVPVDVIKMISDPDLLEKIATLKDNTEDKDNLSAHQTCTSYLYWVIVSSLYELGWIPAVGDKIKLNSFMEKYQIVSEFKHLMRFYFTVLEKENGFLQQISGSETEEWLVFKDPPLIEIAISEKDMYEDKLNKINTCRAYIRLNKKIARNLPQILTGNESALKLLFSSESEKTDTPSVEEYYLDYPLRNSIASLGTVMLETYSKYFYDNICHNPAKRLRVLEVGAGTGSLTFTCVRQIRDICGDQFEYFFTDLSQSFLNKAEEQLDEFKNNMKYNIFNIEQSPLSQGMPLNYFDAIFATDVLHATRDLHESLSHLRQVLKPGGVLFFSETITQSLDITFIFGLLEGYWRFQDFNRRAHHCCVGEDVWKDVISQSGFKYLETVKDNSGTLGIITAMADPIHDIYTHYPVTQNTVCEGEWIIFSEDSNFELTARLSNILVCSGYGVTNISCSEVDKGLLLSDVKVKTIDPADSASMDNILGNSPNLYGVIYAWGLKNENDEPTSYALPFLNVAKNLITESRPVKLFVLTRGVDYVTESDTLGNPTGSVLLAQVKSFRNEFDSGFVRYIDLDLNTPCSTSVDQVLFEVTKIRGNVELRRAQIAYRAGLRYEPRLVKANLKAEIDELKLPLSSDRYQLVLPKSKVIQDLEFSVLEEDTLADDEVEVKVKAYALNFRDIFAIIKPTAQFDKVNAVGLDYAGYVLRVGKNVQHMEIGQRVFGANFKDDDQLPSHLVVNYNTLFCTPENMTDWEAATIPAVFSTAYYCLITVGKMRKDDTVLIHTGSGGVGLAAIHLASQVGATIITTAGNTRKRKYLRSLGIRHVFHSRNTSYEDAILKVTNGRGVDLVLNSITGPGMKEATLKVTAKNGRFIEMSKLSTWTENEVNVRRPDVKYTIVDLTNLEDTEMKTLRADLQNAISRGKLHPIPFVKFDALNIRQALYHFQKAKHIGKIICTMPEVVARDGRFVVDVKLFTPESTYLITGGLGGIGFEVCKWMLQNGAKHIVLTGRTAPKPEIAAKINDMNRKGLNIVVKLADIGQYDQCEALIKYISQNEYPLRGVMHCAGVLRDKLFTNMRWEDFNFTLVPKLRGSWNLHNVTKGLPLEHFVTFSSIVGLIGSQGQSNHSAGNRFQDSLIHYRNSIGLVGTTINWGQWSEVGCAKDANIPGVLPVSVKRMLHALKIAMRSQKIQIGFCEFSSFETTSIMCPILKGYLDDKLFQRDENAKRNDRHINPDQFWKEIDACKSGQEKMDTLSGYIKQIIRSALRLDPDEIINDDANIRELGVDSLMMLELKNTIQGLLGTRLALTTQSIKDCTTIRLLSAAIVEKIINGTDEDVILEPLPDHELLELLVQDSILNQEIASSSEGPCKPSEVENILLTGVTGQLGPYLVAELLKSHKNVKKIVCLVRSIDMKTAEQKFKAAIESTDVVIESSKIECVPGDVALEYLGIPQEKYSKLSESVDAVIHCAAKKANFEPYRPSGTGMAKDIRSVNVGGTNNILKFACSIKTKHVFYASNILAALLDDDTTATNMQDRWHTTGIMEGIVQLKLPGPQATKFVNESLLHEANLRGIPCKVFRFTMLAGESRTGQVQVQTSFYLMRYLSFLKMNAIPSMVLPANILPVDICARLSLRLFLDDNTPNEIFNICHPHPQVEQEFVTLAAEFGKEIGITEWPEFSQKLQNANLEGLKDIAQDQSAFNGYLQEGKGILQGYVLNPENFFYNEKVNNFIPNYAECIPASMDIIRKDLNYCKSIGIFEQFGI